MPLYAPRAAAPATTANSLPVGVKTGRWYSFPYGGAAVTLNVATNVSYVSGFAVPAGLALPAASIGIFVSTVGAGASVKAALYAADDNWEATSLVLDLGSVDATATGNKTFPVVPTLTAGRFVVAITAATATVGMRAIGSGQLVPFVAAPGGSSGMGFSRSGAISSWPSTWDATGTAAIVPRIDVAF